MKKNKEKQEAIVDNGATPLPDNVAETAKQSDGGSSVDSDGQSETTGKHKPDESTAEEGCEAPTMDVADAHEETDKAPAPPGKEEYEARIEEAARRAYLKGRNEAIEELMRRPGMMQPLETAAPPTRQRPEPEIMILNNQRPSIWDR